MLVLSIILLELACLVSVLCFAICLFLLGLCWFLCNIFYWILVFLCRLISLFFSGYMLIYIMVIIIII